MFKNVHKLMKSGRLPKVIRLVGLEDKNDNRLAYVPARRQKSVRQK